MSTINETELLNYLRQNAEAAVNGINLIENNITGEGLKNTISAQKTEYNNLYSEADSLLRKKNGTPENMPVMAKMSASVMGTVKKMTDKTDSDIADSMIAGTSMGITKLTKHLHEYRGNDKEVLDLVNRAITFEEDATEKLKAFL